MIRKSGTSDKPFDVVEGILDLSECQSALVLENMTLARSLSEKFGASFDLLMELLIECAGTWDKDRHPAFSKYAYSRISNEIREDRRASNVRSN